MRSALSSHPATLVQPVGAAAFAKNRMLPAGIAPDAAASTYCFVAMPSAAVGLAAIVRRPVARLPVSTDVFCAPASVCETRKKLDPTSPLLSASLPAMIKDQRATPASIPTSPTLVEIFGRSRFILGVALRIFK